MNSMSATPGDKKINYDSLYSWLTIYLTPGLGANACKKLVDHFGSAKEVLKAGKPALLSVSGIKKTAIDQLVNNPAEKEAEREISKAEKAGITIIPIDSPAFPPSLLNIHNPPAILYLKGSLDGLKNNLALAVVGSRAASSYGLRTAGFLANSLAKRGVTIVSGLALGIDTAAHKGSLAGGGKTIGVLGCGLDVVYPEKNRQLYQEISASGAIISEYPMGTKPDGFRFPARNRIISGLSAGVIVVEASRKSGSLITARQALEQGREVFAIPGQIDSVKSEGAHRLLQEGAKLVHTVEDILEEFTLAHFHHAEAVTPTDLSLSLTNDEMAVISCLDVYPKTIDEIINESGLNTNMVNELLLLLELKGVVEVLPGKQYKKCM